MTGVRCSSDTNPALECVKDTAVAEEIIGEGSGATRPAGTDGVEHAGFGGQSDGFAFPPPHGAAVLEIKSKPISAQASHSYAELKAAVTKILDDHARASRAPPTVQTIGRALIAGGKVCGKIDDSVISRFKCAHNKKRKTSDTRHGDIQNFNTDKKVDN
ncbi:hypothetical protein T492DRAFT_875389 [Pavlovales sp. CCMP2436]|nr:hypothetical protein T492DRAFT_875389 [Pavlovales sp. CCMP2436]